MKKLFCLIALLSWLTLPAGAEPVETSCKDPQTQADLNICAAQAYTRADQILNQLYQQLKQKYPVQTFKHLQQVQLTWLKFRASQCELEAGFYKGGSIRPLIHGRCMESLTLERNRHFKDLLKGPPY